MGIRSCDTARNPTRAPMGLFLGLLLGSDPDLGSDPKSAKSGNSRLSRARFSCSLFSVGLGLVSLS